MAGYPKIWTSILREPWWFELTGIERGIYLQLCIFAKDGHDNGQVVGGSLAEMSVACAVNYRTIGRSLAKMQELGLLSVTKNKRGPVVITLSNYLRWQEMTAKDVAKHLRLSTVKVQSKKATTRPDQTKPDQTKPYGGRPVIKDEEIKDYTKWRGEPEKVTGGTKKGYKGEPKKVHTKDIIQKTFLSPKLDASDHKLAVDYWFERYEQVVGFKVTKFGGKEGKQIKELLKHFDLRQFKYLVDYILTTDDPWISDGRRTIPILYSIRDQIVQRAKGKPVGTVKSRANLGALQEYLQRRKADDERARPQPARRRIE